MATPQPSSAAATIHDAGNNPLPDIHEPRSEEGPVDDLEQDLEDFDWPDLETRFKAAMEQCHEEEQQLANEALVLFEVKPYLRRSTFSYIDGCNR